MKPRALFAAGLFLLALAYLMPGVAPGVVQDDSPETTVVCMELGISHPPGYPLHCLMGRLALLLLPGAPAQALGLWAAMLMALAVTLIALLAMQLTSRAGLERAWLAALSAGLAGLGILALREGVAGAKGSVFGLSLCLILGLLLFGFSGVERSSKLRLLGLGIGLALAHHAWMLFPVLPLLAYAIWKEPGKKSLLLWTLPGLSVYAYLPLRAALHPAWHWGHMVSASELVAHVLRFTYTQAPLAHPALPAWLGLKLALDSFGSSAGSVTLLLATLGLLAILRQGAAWIGGLGLALPLLLSGLYVGHEPRNFHLVAVGLLPAAALAAALAGAGCAWACARLRPKPGLALAGLLPLLLGFQAGRPPQRSQDWAAEDYVSNLDTALPKNSLFLATDDQQIFSLLYLHEAKGRRRDAVLVPVGPYWKRFVADDLEPMHPELQGAESGNIGDFIGRAMVRLPVMTGSAERWEKEKVPGKLVSQGLLWRFQTVD